MIGTSRRLANQLRRYLRAGCVLAAHPDLLTSRGHVFVLSHMRSYTSLLAHILGSHPEICGYAEAWFARGKTSYQTSLDLLKLRCVACVHQNYKPAAHYFLDKIVGNEISIADSILSRRATRCVFMIREPEATLRSILALREKYIREGSPKGDSPLPRTIEAAAEYYISRLRALVKISARLRKLGRVAFVIRAEQLIVNPKPVLADLGRFLGLATPLQERYSVFEQTGAWNWGDTSEFIRKGQIERNRPKHAQIAVPAEVLRDSRDAYEASLSQLEADVPCDAAGALA